LAQVLKSKDETDAAIKELQACVALKPNYAEAQMTWAYCFSIAAKLSKPSKHFARP